MINEYQTKTELNPTLWSGDRLRPKLRVAFLKIANAFYKFLEIPPEAEIMDIVLIGSNANYNWNEHSDIDLHVLINYLQIDSNYHMANKYLHAKKSVWNANYPLEYKGMRIELYAQDSAQELHASTGIYSVLHGKWIRKPDPDVISIDDSIIELKAEPYEYEIDSLELDDPHLQQKISVIKQRLRDLRQSGLDAAGEYSIENLAYKYLRNKGYLDRLKELEHSYTMADLQIETQLTESMYGKTKQRVKRFLAAIDTEKEETKEAFRMLMRHINGETLTAEEWKFVRGQMKDVVKLLGLTTMAIVPGGTLVALLAKAVKADKYMLPSAFKNKPEDKEVTESLINHINGTSKLNTDGWKHVISKTNAVLDSMGQWKHPGKCTLIPTQTGRITMKNVPHEVFGIDNTGHSIMMSPDQEYEFPGRLVFEIPNTAQWKTMIMQLQNAAKNGANYAK